MLKGSKQRVTSRTTAAVALAVVGLAMGTSTSAADIDSTSSILDRQDRTVEAIQSDTHINFVSPLDGNPLTREWFHDGKAAFHVTGPNSDAWSGRITLGYQVGYPATLDGKLRFSWSSPSLGAEVGDAPKLVINNLIPTIGIELAAGFGPGIKDVEAAGGDVYGSEGYIQMSGLHATVTGVLGQVTIRPWVRVITGHGDSVTTYGPLWTI
ncbi:MspA family porin [Nocardia sp. NPDC051030]|uniref:MspA family porin n=1 Tax=Nocardia sp. NPDC051030 TaxID=3155162 RepID=UPI0034440B06